MRKALLATLALLVMSAIPAAAQDRSQGGFSDQFTFDANSLITTWNGVTNAYPYAMGSVSLVNVNYYGSGIDVPFQLGYLNNGELLSCLPMNFGPQIWTIGTGTAVGDTFFQSSTTTCPYYTGEYETYLNSNNRLDGFSVVAKYVYVLSNKRICPRFKPCYYPIIPKLAGGTGTITDTIINQ
jgi:hypothetical protein